MELREDGPEVVSPLREARATEHQVLAWVHEGLAFVEAGLVPEDFKTPLFELMEERFERIAGLEDQPERAEGEFVAEHPKG